MRTDDLVGTEFDWVAVDQTGNIGIFSTAGYGPVPKVVLNRTEDHETLIDWIGDHAALPAFADLTTFAGDVPIYGFDRAPHSGPYRRVQPPRGFPPSGSMIFPKSCAGRLSSLTSALTVLKPSRAAE